MNDFFPFLIVLFLFWSEIAHTDGAFGRNRNRTLMVLIIQLNLRLYAAHSIFHIPLLHDGRFLFLPLRLDCFKRQWCEAAFAIELNIFEV